MSNTVIEKRKIIGLCGLIGSGKDTVAASLVNQDYLQLSFAAELKRTVARVFNLDINLLLGVSDISRDYREQIIPRIGVSPRVLLQQTGEAMRKIHPKVWVDHVEKEMMNHIALGHRKFVISDVRYPNERKFIADCGGLAGEVVKGEKPEWSKLMVEAGFHSYEPGIFGFKRPTYLAGIHKSEWLMQCVDMQDGLDFTIEDNCASEDLEMEVDVISKAMDSR